MTGRHGLSALAVLTTATTRAVHAFGVLDDGALISFVSPLANGTVHGFGSASKGYRVMFVEGAGLHSRTCSMVEAPAWVQREFLSQLPYLLGVYNNCHALAARPLPIVAARSLRARVDDHFKRARAAQKRGKLL